jgi:hypothetical protein
MDIVYHARQCDAARGEMPEIQPSCTIFVRTVFELSRSFAKRVGIDGEKAASCDVSLSFMRQPTRRDFYLKAGTEHASLGPKAGRQSPPSL